MKSILTNITVLGMIVSTLNLGWADDGHRLPKISTSQNGVCETNADCTSIVSPALLSSTTANPRFIIEKTVPLKTKISSTGHIWRLAGINEAGEEFWEEPETGFIYSPKFSPEIIKNYTERNNIRMDGSNSKFDYQAGARKFCESRNDLGKKWTIPTGVHLTQDPKNIDSLNKQFNVAETHGVRSILGISKQDWLWTNSPGPKNNYGLVFVGNAGKVGVEFKSYGKYKAVCVSVGGASS